MLRTDAEYNEAINRLEAEATRLDDQQKKLAEMGLDVEEIKRAMDPLRSFHHQLAEEVESYERLKRGEFNELTNFSGFGRLIIALRIYKGLSQRKFAAMLGIDPSQVSRDERNEYHGITIERGQRILEVLGVELHTSIAQNSVSSKVATQV